MKIDLISQQNNIITVSPETCQIFTKNVAKIPQVLNLSIYAIGMGCYWKYQKARVSQSLFIMCQHHDINPPIPAPDISCAGDIKSPFKLILLRFYILYILLLPAEFNEFSRFAGKFLPSFFQVIFQVFKNSAWVFERFFSILFFGRRERQYIDFPLYFVFSLHNHKLFA